jgi:protein SCO1/2
MPEPAVTNAFSESEFAALVNTLGAEAASREKLVVLLREDHPVYDERGTAAIVRMRGWILITLGRAGLNDQGLLLVLEELDAGRDAYLVAAAARALRSFPIPRSEFAPFLVRALNNIRYHDEPVTFDRYGEYATAATDLTPIRELLTTLAWLGPAARDVLAELELLRANRGGFSPKIVAHLDRTIMAIEETTSAPALATDACCSFPLELGNAFSWARGFRRSCETIGSTRFEDHDGASITFAEFFRGHPSIVVFFYTRCDNPQKCSLTIAKLARIQGLLAERGLTDRIRTAAITYDPAFDGPQRIRGYGKNRGVQFGPSHRMLRPVDGIAALRNYFKLGVNFVESLVNRHRIEIYLLDAEGAIAASHERIHWDERQMVDRAAELLQEKLPAPRRGVGIVNRPPPVGASVPFFGALASVGFAFFPKCPFCWAAYLSVFGVAGLKQIPYSPWLQPLFVLLMLLNLFSVWVRGRTTRRAAAFCLVTAGAFAIILSRAWPVLGEPLAWSGVALTLAGSFLSVAQSVRRKPALFFLRAAPMRDYVPAARGKIELDAHA